MNDRIYEIGYLVLPHAGEAGANTVIDGIKAELTTMGAEHISEDAPGLIDLAYDMSKIIDNKKQVFETAYFGWVKFALDPEHIEALTKMLDAHPELLRHLLIKTVREDTMIKKPTTKREMATPESHKETVADSEETSNEPEKEVDQQELDAKLEEVAEDTNEEAEA